MGLSSSKSKTTTDQKTSETGTTTPTNPPWVTDSIEEYTHRLGAFGDMDPNSFVAGASPLQQQAWGNVDKLADWQGQAKAASQMALQAGQAPPNYAGREQALPAGRPQQAEPGAAGPLIESVASGAAPRATGGSMKPRSGPTAGMAMMASPQQAPQEQGPAYAYNPTTGQASTYQAPQLGDANLVSARGYDAPQLGAASGYAAPRIGQPIGANAYNYTAQPTGRTAIDPATNAQATDAQSQSLLTGLGDYYNPFAKDVIQSTMADFSHNADEQRAQLAAQGARSGAFGGSRFGVAQAELEGEIGRNRANLLAGLRSQAFDTAAGLSEADTARRQGTSQFNAGNRTGISALNAGSANSRALAQAGLDQDRQLNDSAAVNAQRHFAAGEGGLSSRFNSTQGLQAGLAQAQLDEGALRHQADANNAYGLAQAGYDQDAAQFNATLGESADARNQTVRNAFALEQAGMLERQGQTNSGRQQDMNLAGLGYMNDAAKTNALENNAMSRFNALQGDNAAQRQLEAAGLLGNLSQQYGQGVRDDLGLMNGMGADQRAIEQMYAMAPLAQLQSLGQLYGTTPYNLFSGQNVTGNGTMQGTNVTRQTPSLFDQMLAAASVGAKVAGAV